MSYIVEVERNYKAFHNCLQTLIVPRNQIFHRPQEFYMELKRLIEEKYNIECHLIQVDGALVWNTLEFKSEQDYLIWLMKYS